MNRDRDTDVDKNRGMDMDKISFSVQYGSGPIFFWNFLSKKFILPNTIAMNWKAPMVEKTVLAYIAKLYLRQVFKNAHKG